MKNVLLAQRCTFHFPSYVHKPGESVPVIKLWKLMSEIINSFQNRLKLGVLLISWQT